LEEEHLVFLSGAPETSVKQVVHRTQSM
jgi:hypothetical protein